MSIEIVVGLGVGILFVTANYGGRLVFDHAAAIPSSVLQEELHERSEGHHHHGDEEAESPAATADSVAEAAPDHVDSAEASPHTHTHPPGTPPHKD